MRVVDLLERSARLYPEHPAVVVVGGPTVDHRSLRRRVGALASGLAERGVGPGDRIAIMAANGLPFFDVYLAAAYLGAAAVPIDVRLTPDEVGFVLDDAEPAVVFADPQHLDAVGAGGHEVVEVGGADYDALLATDEAPGLAERPCSDDVALIIYTSGTTGRPKGVCLSQHALAFNAVTMAAVQRLGHGDVFMSMTPLYHAATGTRVSSMLVDGLTHVVLPKFDVATALEAIATHRVTSTIAVPTQLRRILEHPALGSADLSSMRLLVYGAAPTGLDLVRRAIDTFDFGLYQGYGLSEATTNLTGLLPSDHRPDSSDELLRSCGRPVPGVEISLRDDDGRRVPLGEPGEIWVRSDKVMSGYWRRPAATAEVLVDGWLRTGDIAVEGPGGYLSIVDRAKDMLISGGVNVYPSEIERALREWPGVRDVAVVGRPDDEWGEVPVAFLVLEEGTALDETAVVEHCRSRLAGPKVPRAFAVVDDLPRTATGKVRKPVLRELLRTSANSC